MQKQKSSPLQTRRDVLKKKKKKNAITTRNSDMEKTKCMCSEENKGDMQDSYKLVTVTMHMEEWKGGYITNVLLQL